MSVSLLHDAPWSFCFYSLQKFSGQQILVVCLKNFEWIFSFALRLVVHIHALRKIRFGGSKAMDPILFCHYLFFKTEIYFFSKGIYSCSPNFYYFFSKTQTRLGKTA